MALTDSSSSNPSHFGGRRAMDWAPLQSVKVAHKDTKRVRNYRVHVGHGHEPSQTELHFASNTKKWAAFYGSLT